MIRIEGSIPVGQEEGLQEIINIFESIPGAKYQVKYPRVHGRPVFRDTRSIGLTFLVEDIISGIPPSSEGLHLPDLPLEPEKMTTFKEKLTAFFANDGIISPELSTAIDARYGLASDLKKGNQLVGFHDIGVELGYRRTDGAAVARRLVSEGLELLRIHAQELFSQ